MSEALPRALQGNFLQKVSLTFKNLSKKNKMLLTKVFEDF